MGKDGTEGNQRREPMGRTASRLAKLITADRGLVALAAMFGVRHTASSCQASHAILTRATWAHDLQQLVRQSYVATKLLITLQPFVMPCFHS